MRLLEDRQFAIGVLAHLLFEPVRDLGGMKLPIAGYLSARNAAAIDELLNLATVASQLAREFI